MPTTVTVVRVFTDTKGGFGNELGIVHNSADTKGREQQIATALGFSETVFVDELSGSIPRVLILTPAGELPFAGHPTVGIAWWQGEQGTPAEALDVKAGRVPVRYESDYTWVSGRAEWAPDFSWMPLANSAKVDALDPADFTSGMNYAYAWIDESAGILRARMFGPEHGIAEDEATGSAAIAITTRLDRDLEIHQGRGSVIVTRRLPGGMVELGGRVEFDRTIELP